MYKEQASLMGFLDSSNALQPAAKKRFLEDELSLEIQSHLRTVLPAAEPCLFCPMATVTHTAQTGREIILTCSEAQGLHIG